MNGCDDTTMKRRGDRRTRAASSGLGAEAGRLVSAWRGARSSAPAGGVDPVARVRIEDLARQIERLESRLNLILAAIVGTLVVDILKAFVR